VSASAVAAAGLFLDIVGAVLLASAIFLRRADQALEEASPKWNFNADLHAGLARQTADAQAGLFLLVLGFTGQFVSAVGWSPTGVRAWAAAGYAVFVTVLGVLLILFDGLRPRYVQTALLKQLERSDVNEWWILLRAYGGQLGRHREANQAWADFGSALLGADTWSRLTTDRALPASLTDPQYIDIVGDQNEFRAFQS
jgi:hypothetical protein